MGIGWDENLELFAMENSDSILILACEILEFEVLFYSFDREIDNAMI